MWTGHKIHKIVQYKPPESDKKFAFPPRTFQKSLLSSPSETSLALYSLEYCLLNLFLDRERERKKTKTDTKVTRKSNGPLTSALKSNQTESVLRPGPPPRIRIFLNPQLFLSGYGYRPHASGEFGSESGSFCYVWTEKLLNLRTKNYPDTCRRGLT